jgi:gamma-glutamyltranspeptidase/glutathione hydrolase
MGRAKAGDPPFQKRSSASRPRTGIEFGTSHISVVDRNGNAVSMTTTIEDGFGARIMTRSGFLLNNELTDFNFAPTEEGKPGGEPGRGRQAPAQLHGADAGARCQ